MKPESAPSSSTSRRGRIRQIPNSSSIPSSCFRTRRLYGLVNSVGDGDNFHFFHTPGGKLLGWGWARPEFPVLGVPGNPISNSKLLNGQGNNGRNGKNNSKKWTQKTQTLHIRIAGIDAPEAAHFGRPAQPYSAESLEWLREYILGRHVRVLPLANDQYGRTVADVWVRGDKWYNRFKYYNVPEEMLKAGWATVYEAKYGAEYNGKKEMFMRLEQEAKNSRKGIFVQGSKIETPRQYKNKYRGRK